MCTRHHIVPFSIHLTVTLQSMDMRTYLGQTHDRRDYRSTAMML